MELKDKFPAMSNGQQLKLFATNKNVIGFYEKQGFAYSGICKNVNLGETLVERFYIKGE